MSLCQSVLFLFDCISPARPLPVVGAKKRIESHRLGSSFRGDTVKLAECKGRCVLVASVGIQVPCATQIPLVCYSRESGNLVVFSGFLLAQE